MSNERFDRLMKQNLESVRPGYQPSAWNRFQKRLPLGFWARLLPYGGWLLSGLMLTGWLTTLYTLHTNQQVIQQLTKTLAVRTDSVKLSPTPAAPSASTHRVDTVYIVQRTVIEHRYLPDRKTGLMPGSDRITSRNQPTTDRGDYPATRTEPQADSRFENTPTTDLRSAGITKRVTRTTVDNRGGTEQVSRTKPTDRKLVTPVRSGSVQDNVVSDSKPKPRLTTPLPATMLGMSEADSVNRAIAQATATIPVDSNRTQIDKAAATVVKADSVARKPANLSAVTSVPAVEPAKQSRPPFRLSSLQPRVGIETGVTRNGVGVGPAIEFFPTENLGISIGVKASQFQLEEHKGLQDFNAATGTVFIEQYRAFLPAQYDEIKDISVRTSLISLPVYLKYYVPLRRNWSLLFQTGTSFDIAANQQVRYESYFRGEEQYHSFDVDTQPRFFHNFMFGAGVQYRRSRVSAQLGSYYVYDFRNIANTPAGSNVGIWASVWLDLFKP